MPTPPRSRLSARPLTQAELLGHFKDAETLMDRALNLEDEAIVDLQTRNPTGRPDEWRLSVACGPLLGSNSVVFGAQFTLSLLVDCDEICSYGDIDYEPVFEQQCEIHLFDRDWRTITCAFAAWLLRVGWIIKDGELTTTEAIECDFSIVPEGNLLCTQKVRTRGTPPIEPPHWQRANELRKAWQDRQPAELSEQEAREAWKQWEKSCPDEEPWF